MAYYYVKEGGTATGDAGRYATKQTGTFAALGAANYYDTLNDAFSATTVPDDGDIVFITDAAVHDVGSVATQLSSPANGDGKTVSVICVSDTAIDTPSTGGGERNGTGVLLARPGSTLYMHGVELNIDTTNANGPNGSTARVIMSSCRTAFTGTSSDPYPLQLNSDGDLVQLYDHTFVQAGGGTHGKGALIRAGSRLEVYGGTLEGTFRSFLRAGFDFGGGSALIVGVDFTNISNSTVRYLLEDVGSDISATDTIDVTFVRCKLPSNLQGVVEETLGLAGARKVVRIIGCDDTSQERTEIYCNEGEIVLLNTPYITAQTAMANSAQSVWRIQTKTGVGPMCPLVLPLPVQSVAIDDAGSDNLRLKICTSGAGVTLTDNDVHLRVYFSDNTDPMDQTERLSGQKMGQMPHFDAAGTTLTTTSGVWTSLPAGGNEYDLTFDLSSEDPEPSPAVIMEAELFVCKELTGSDYIYVDTELTAD